MRTPPLRRLKTWRKTSSLSTCRPRRLSRHSNKREKGNLDTFLSDPDTVRHPTRLVLEYGEMGLHQFAQPEPDHRLPGGRVLYLRPVLGQRPDLIALAVSYMIPVINYGDIITDAHCLAYGARLMGMDEGTYYSRICELADFTGARGMSEDDPNSHVPASDPNRGTPRIPVAARHHNVTSPGV